jgi:hypothetical protein
MLQWVELVSCRSFGSNLHSNIESHHHSEMCVPNTEEPTIHGLASCFERCGTPRASHHRSPWSKQVLLCWSRCLPYCGSFCAVAPRCAVPQPHSADACNVLATSHIDTTRKQHQFESLYNTFQSIHEHTHTHIPTYPYASSVGRLPNVLVFRSQSLLPSDLDVVDDVSSLLFLPSSLLHRSRCVCVCVGVLTLPGNHVGAQARTPSRHGSSMSNYRRLIV